MRFMRYLAEWNRFQRALENVDWSILSQMFWWWDIYWRLSKKNIQLGESHVDHHGLFLVQCTCICLLDLLAEANRQCITNRIDRPIGSSRQIGKKSYSRMVLFCFFSSFLCSRLEMCGNGLQHSHSLPFPWELESHSHARLYSRPKTKLQIFTVISEEPIERT